MSNQHHSEKTIFNAALQFPNEEARTAYLKEACGDDLPLRLRVEALLRDHPEVGSFMENPPTAVLPVTEQPSDRIGRYKLLEKIGEGGMGVVYMAEQQEPVRRTVALKIIKLGMDTRQVVARFEAERQALAMMDQPHIAKVLDAGATDSGRPYFVMELVRGIPITEYCDKNHLPTRPRLELFIQVCQAVQHAHQKGIIHRDLKPSNVLVTLNDGVPWPMIIDFGVAKATNQRLTEKTLFTHFAQMIGTPAYMSPEQAEMSKLDVDTRTDIYALGVLLYELLTGAPPFPTRELLSLGYQEMQRTIAEKEPLRPSTRLSAMADDERSVVARNRNAEASALAKLFRGDLDWIAMKCLEKDRTRRYETANELALDIRRQLQSEPVVARPPSNLYRFQKMVRRNKLAFAAAGAVAAALVIGFSVSLWNVIETRKAHRRAIGAEKQQSLQRQRAEAAEKQARDEAKRAEAALTEMKIQRAEDLFAVDDSARAVAHLASVLTSDPLNRVAADRLLSALTFRNFSLPLPEPLRHQGGVRSAQFSPDGLRVVTASYDKTARVWEAQTGKPLAEPLRHQGGVLSAEFSPDGLRVVTASGDKTARVWDAQTGRPLTEPLRHEGYVHSAQFSPDGLRVVTASYDKTARVWDAQTGHPLTEPLRHEGRVYSALFSPDGLRVVTASDDKTARVWDAQTGQPLTEPLRHQDEVWSAQFSPDGLRVVTASEDKTARVWDAQTGQPLTEPLRHEIGVNSAQFSPDGLRVVTASEDKTARVWDVQTEKPLTEPLRHESFVYSAQFSPDGLRVVTASEDKTARVWDAQTGKPLTEPLRHERGVHSAQFSPDGLRVVTASHDETTARVWDAQTGKSLTEPLRHERRVYSAQFSSDGLRVVTASDDKTARVWEAQTGHPLTEPLRHEETVCSAQFSPDGLRVVTASFDKTARVWDAQNGRPLTEPLRHERAVISARFSPDGLRVVTASDDKTARVWDAQTGKPLTEPLRHEDWVVSARFSPDGLRVVTASGDKTARVWNAQTGQPLTEPLRHEGIVVSAQFSPNGLQVVTTSRDNTARVWDAQTGKPLTEPLRHEGEVSSAQFSPDGLRVVTASWDKTARVWDAQTGQPLTEPLRHDGGVYSAQFSPDGLRVLTASDDKTARVWEAQTGKPLTEPLQHQGIVISAQFSPDGLWVATASDDKTARVWGMTFSSGPAPPWLPQLAVSVAGQRLSGTAVLEPVAPEEFLKLKEQLILIPATNFYTRWAKWFCADRATRTISPLSSITVRERLQRRIEEDTLESLREAVGLSPNNAVALARLARRVLNEDVSKNPRREVEAGFHLRRAMKLSPDSPEVLLIAKEIGMQVGVGQKRKEE